MGMPTKRAAIYWDRYRIFDPDALVDINKVALIMADEAASAMGMAVGAYGRRQGEVFHCVIKQFPIR